MPGTSTIMPTRPYTTEGMPASSDTASVIALRTGFGAIFARYTAVIKPIGTPTSIAPAVPYTLVSMNGSMPNCGSFAVDAHSVPNRKSPSPIFVIAGMPDTTRYTVMSATLATVTSPRQRNMPCIIISVKFLIFIALS